MAFDQATLDQARKSGYSDEEIYSHLAASDPRFKEAQKNGYKLDEVAAFLGQSRKGGFDPDKYLAAAEKEKGVVAPGDLKKITLFDVGPGFGSTYDRCTGFHGRVRNDLPRAVEKIGVNYGSH